MNNTKVRVKIKGDELIQAAFRELVSKGEIPFGHPNTPQFRSKFDIGFDNPSTREGMWVEFYVVEKQPEQEKSKEAYKEGSWKDPEVD